jgi:4-amino-4-deoxy-L-arabinose transferase-like glycosyltransferase
LSTAPSPSSPSRVRASLVLLFVVAPFFATAPFPGLLNPDEGRYAEVASEMLVTGDYLVPRLHGTPRWSKPPGTYWCAALSMKAFGFTPFAARLPSAIFGAIAVFSLYKLVAEAFDRRTGLYAAVVFASATSL